MSTNHTPTAPLQTIVGAAKQFGLTDDEISHVVNECFSWADVDSTVGDCLDEIVIALARRVLQVAGESSRRRSRARGHLI
jgi:hypothetical protein